LVGEDIQRQLGLSAKETHFFDGPSQALLPSSNRFPIKINYIKNQTLILFKHI
jgi:hypothetical protein